MLLIISNEKKYKVGRFELLGFVLFCFVFKFSSKHYFWLSFGNFSLSWYKMISRETCQIMVIMIQVRLRFNFLTLFTQQL